MVKRKKNISDMISKREVVKKSVNPFEVHINRQKFNVLNRKLKTDRGLPGISRAKAIKKRKETLLQEYKVINKTNKFVDKRIGERNSAMTKEDRIIARFSAERMKSHKRKEIFNLADDEVLTHKGKSIADIEKFDDPLDDDDDTEKGLDAKFVEEANFGGGVLQESKNNRMTVIEQLIADSKKRKAERQLAKERTLQKTEELDAEWKELIPVVSLGKPPPVDVSEKKDSYDLILNDLKFEPRGTPSDKLKTEGEIAEEEARKLKELEEERLRRMRGEDVTESTPKIQHRSADDLDDGFEIEEEDNFEVAYDKDGNLIGADKIKGLKKKSSYAEQMDSNSEKEDSENEDEAGSEDSEDEEDEDETNMEAEDEDAEENNEESDNDIDDLSDLKVTTNEDKEENDSEGELDVETKSTPSDNKANLKVQYDIQNKEDNMMEDGSQANSDSKLKTKKDEATDNGEVSSELKEDVKKKIKEKKKVSFGKEQILLFQENTTSLNKTPEEIEKENEERKMQMEKARKELPYAFEVPETHEELQELLKDKSVYEQAVVIERMIKCNHPSLNEKNKEKLENLFAILMQHLNDSDPAESWSLLDRLAPYLYDLTQFSPQNAAYCLSEVILEKHSDYSKKISKYPSTETLLFLKLVPLLFPTSDKRHSVTTAAFIFISEMLHNCQVTTRRAITSGLFLVSIFTEYICISKRIMPEALNFLCGIIHLATPSTQLPVVPPFKKEHKFLFLHKSYSDQNSLSLNMLGSDLVPRSGLKIDDTFRIRTIYCALKLTEVLAKLYEGFPAAQLLIEPIRKHLVLLEIEKYPSAVQKAHEELMTLLDGIMGKKLEPITIKARKPKALRLYEPNIEPVYDMKKKNLPPEKAEHSKLLYKYKQEMKGALREIRRDRQFISKLKFKEQASSDAERKRKVKEIYSWGAQQQSEFNKLKRKRK